MKSVTEFRRRGSANEFGYGTASGNALLAQAAEFIVLPATQAVALPEKISFDAGACLGIPAMTAAHAIALADVGKGTTVLVSGGAGAVSQYVHSVCKSQRRGLPHNDILS